MTKQKNKNLCDGCGKPFDFDYQAYRRNKDRVAIICLAPGVEVRVCGTSKHSSAYWRQVDTEYAPKLACLRKAFEARNVCPGCGEPRESGDGPIGPVCSVCAELIKRARTTLGDRPTTYLLHTDLITSAYPESRGEEPKPHELAERVLETIARIAQSTGPREGPDTLPQGCGIRLPESRDNYGDVSVQLDAKQREAVEKLGAVIKQFTDAMYHQGRRAGRDLLTGLATGDVSIGDFADKHTQWNEEEQEDDHS